MDKLKQLEDRLEKLERKLCCHIRFYNGSLPDEGVKDVLYIDETLGEQFIWDGSTYISVAETVLNQIPHKTYVALLFQSGTNAPTAQVLENSIGITPEMFSYDDVGKYTLTGDPGMFPQNNTIVFFSPNGQDDTTDLPTLEISYDIYPSDVIGFSSLRRDTGAHQNHLLVRTPVVIKVYQ